MTENAEEPTSAESAGINADGLYRKVFWRIVPFLILCYVVAYLDRVNAGFAKLQMRRDLGFSDAVFGLGFGIFFIGYFLFELPSNLILYRVGARTWIARIMITWGLISGCFVWVSSPHGFYFLRFLLGVAEAGFYPGIILYLTQWFPAHRRAKIIAIFMFAIPISNILGNPLSGWILSFRDHPAAGMWDGWQWMFLLEALPAILVGIAVLFILDDDFRGVRWLTSPEKDFLEQEIQADHKHKESPEGLVAVFSDPRIWHMSLINFCFTMGQYGLTFWMPTMIQDSGVKSKLNIGLISAVPYLAALIAMYAFGHSADARRERRWHLIIPALMGAAGYVVAAEMAVLDPHNTTLAVIFLSIAAAGALTLSPLFWSLPTSFLSGTAAAAGIAVINSFSNLAGFASPYLIGWLKDATQSNLTGMFTIALTLVIGAVGTLAVPAKYVNR